MVCRENHGSSAVNKAPFILGVLYRRIAAVREIIHTEELKTDGKGPGSIDKAAAAGAVCGRAEPVGGKAAQETLCPVMAADQHAVGLREFGHSGFIDILADARRRNNTGNSISERISFPEFRGDDLLAGAVYIAVIGISIGFYRRQSVCAEISGICIFGCQNGMAGLVNKAPESIGADRRNSVFIKLPDTVKSR